MSFSKTLELNGVEVDVEVNITHYQPYRYGRSGHPDHWMPDEPEEVEFKVLADGCDITAELSDSDYDYLEQCALEYIKERDYDNF